MPVGFTEWAVRMKSIDDYGLEVGRKSNIRVKIVLRSTESSYRYHTTKNKRNQPGRMEIRKFDPVLRKHVLFKESK